MALAPKGTGPAGEQVKFRRARSKRNKRRPIEAVPQDWDRWDAAAAVLGLNFSEFARRALNQAAQQTENSLRPPRCGFSASGSVCVLDQGHEGPHYAGQVAREPR
jgi:hypothetical protein